LSLNPLKQEPTGHLKPAARKRWALWREQAITLACRALAWGFDLPRRITDRPVPRLQDLAPGARVLIIKPCCLGDVILTTATIAAIAGARPDLQIDYLVSDWSRPVLAGHPRLSRLVPTGVSGSNLGWRRWLGLAWKLRRTGDYRAALVLDRSPRLNLLPWLAGIPLRAGVDNLWRGFALNVRATQTGGLKHEAEVYLDVARALGIRPENPHLEFFVPLESEASFRQKARSLGLDLDRPIATLHPAGGQNPDTQVLSKRWPPVGFGAIAARLAAQGWQVILIGAATDRPVVQEVLAAVPDGSSANIIDGCGQFDLTESGALLAHSRLFVGNDTGLMHLAAAAGTAVVAIFGPSSPVAYGPYTPRGRAVSPLNRLAPALAGLPLKEYQALSLAEGGISSVSVEMVWESVQDVERGTGNVER
jgi:lipopolysaccharide heptosyltransferase II